MTSALLITLVLVAAIVGFVFLVVSRQPDDFRVARATTVAAPAARIHPLLADFHRWSAWSPWEHRDPAMTRRFDGPPSGLGAVYEWSGDKRVGAGRMEIVEVELDQRVVIQLDFYSPVRARNRTEFALNAMGDKTQVVWSMTGTRPFMLKLMGLVMNMDRMVGPDFEAGLAKLRSAAED